MIIETPRTYFPFTKLDKKKKNKKNRRFEYQRNCPTMITRSNSLPTAIR